VAVLINPAEINVERGRSSVSFFRSPQRRETLIMFLLQNQLFVQRAHAQTLRIQP